MERELNNNLITKYRILDTIYDLSLVQQFIGTSDTVTIYGELEIEPFVEFSLAFQANYWYLQYMLLKNGEIDLEKNEQMALYNERDLNIIWLNIKNESDTVIECKDGIWFFNLSKQDERSKTLLDNYTFSR